MGDEASDIDRPEQDPESAHWIVLVNMRRGDEEESIKASLLSAGMNVMLLTRDLRFGTLMVRDVPAALISNCLDQFGALCTLTAYTGPGDDAFIALKVAIIAQETASSTSASYLKDIAFGSLRREPEIANDRQRNATWCKFEEALRLAHPKFDELEMMLREQLGLALEDFVPSNRGLIQVVHRLVEEFLTRGWIDKLVCAARRHNPGNPDLQLLTDVEFNACGVCRATRNPQQCPQL